MLASDSIITQIAPWLILGVGFIGAAWINKRGQTGDAVTYLQNANKVLHDENAALKRERLGMIAEIAVLREKTDIALALMPLRGQMDSHERRAEERHKRMIAILGMIAEKMGKELGNTDDGN